MREFFPAWGLLLSLGPGLLWVAAALAFAPQGFAGEALGRNLIGRFFQGTSHPRSFYYFAYQFPVDFLPWTLLLPIAWRVGRREAFAPGADPGRRDAWRFLLSWVGASFVFFSISTGKRGLYMLPAFPAAALLCGDALARTLAGRRALPRAFMRIAIPLAIVAAIGAAGVLVLREVQGIALPTIFGIAVLAFLLAGLLAWLRFDRRDAPASARMALLAGGTVALEFAIFVLLFPAFNPVKSTRPIAVAAAAITPPGRPVGLFGDNPMLGGLVYYGGRPIRYMDRKAGLRRFVTEGGTAIVTQTKRVEEVRGATPVEVRATFWSGRRAFVLLTPARPAGGAGAK